MNNLERAAAIAAERGVSLVEPYRGWRVRVSGPRHLTAWCPHEVDWRQFCQIADGAGITEEEPLHVTCLTVYDSNRKGLEGALTFLHGLIDRFEAAREAMPATAFFGVEEEVLL